MSNYQAVRDKFDKKRDAAIADAEKRKNDLRKKSPAFAKADDEIMLLGVRLLRVMQDIGTDGSEEIMKIKAEMKERRKERAAALAAEGLPEDYTKPRFECEKCEDTGLVGVNVCDCFIKALRTENYLTSGLGKTLVRQRFENFDLSLYPADVRDDMKSVFELCREYASGFSRDSDSLLFIGGTGLGKTHLSSAIAMKVLDRGFSVVYDTAQSVFSAFEKNRFEKDESDTAKYSECDLLIIDDLGSEFKSNMNESTLYGILNARMNAQKSTIINTNLSPADLHAKYDDRIISRLFGQFTVLWFSGKDIRMQKLMKE